MDRTVFSSTKRVAPTTTSTVATRTVKHKVVQRFATLLLSLSLLSRLSEAQEAFVVPVRYFLVPVVTCSEVRNGLFVTLITNFA